MSSNKISEVGKYTYGVQNISIRSWNEIEGTRLSVGAFCSIASNCVVYLGGNHRPDWYTTYPFGHIHRDVFPNFDGAGHPGTNGSVRIGNDVWIGDNATIMSGVTVGDGAVIAANSHVVKDVPPYGIVGGNPARLIRKRFPPERIELLLALKWWDWDDRDINEALPTLCSDGSADTARTLVRPR